LQIKCDYKKNGIPDLVYYMQSKVKRVGGQKGAINHRCAIKIVIASSRIQLQSELFIILLSKISMVQCYNFFLYIYIYIATMATEGTPRLVAG
jgi:hypothetical protein